MTVTREEAGGDHDKLAPLREENCQGRGVDDECRLPFVMDNLPGCLGWEYRWPAQQRV
jgi:hypothetical protein